MKQILILQSDNGSEFTASVITELKSLWPDLIIVHGKPRHPQSQGSVERLNCDVKDMLVAWLGDNNSTDWPVGLKFVQFAKNTSYHSGIKQSPYSALFETAPRVGLRSSSLPTEIIERMASEDDLLAAFNLANDDGSALSTVSDVIQPVRPSSENTVSDVIQPAPASSANTVSDFIQPFFAGSSSTISDVI